MRDPMKCRRIERCSVVPSEDFSVRDQYIYDVPKLTQQLRDERMGALPRDADRPDSDSYYDEDDVAVVDPSFDPSLDRFERTEAIATQISERMRDAHREELEHANA